MESRTSPTGRSRHFNSPVLDRQKKTILLFGSFTLSGIKPHELSKSQAVINKSDEYVYKYYQPATFNSVLTSIRTFSSTRHIDPSRVSKIFIAIDYKPFDKSVPTFVQKEKFQEAFSVLVNIINTDLYPGTDLIFQSILPKCGLLREIKEQNRWFRDAAQTSQGTWCEFMECSKLLLTDRGDVNSELYNVGLESSRRDKARLLSEQGMKVLIEKYKTFFKQNDRFDSLECSNSKIPSEIDGEQIRNDLQCEESACYSNNTREENPPAMKVLDLSSLIGEMSRATEKFNEITQFVTERKVETVEEHLAHSLINDNEEMKALEICAETLVNTGVTYLERQFDEFYQTDIIEPFSTSQNEVIDELTDIEFKWDADTDFIGPKMEEFRRKIETESMQLVAKLAISNIDTFRRANQKLYHFRRRTEDDLGQNKRLFTKLTKTVNFSSDEETLAHLEQMENLITKFEEIYQ